MKIGNSILAAIVLLLVTHSAHALDPSQPIKNYIQTRFTTDNGLSTNIINGIVQSRDGFLWVQLGTLSLARFDGQRFSDLPFEHVTAMTIGPNGDLWIVSRSTLKQIPAAALTQHGPLPAISYPIDIPSDDFVVCLYFSRSGVLWIGTDQGLYRFQNGIISSVLSKLHIGKIEESSNGNVLLSTGQGFMVWDGSRVGPHPEVAAQLGVKPQEIFHVLEDSRGVTWICTSLGVARRVGNSIEKLQPWGGKKNGFLRAYEDPQGNVWITGAEGGLFRVSGAALELALKDVQVRCMYGDRDGNLWIGTNTDGLFRFKDRAVRMFTIADGLPGNLPMTVLTSHDGTLWIGFNCGGLVRYDGHDFRTYNEKDGLLNSCIYALAEDANHDLWIGTWGGGAFRFHNNAFTQYSKPQGMPGDIVLSVLPSRDGSLWFGTYGLSHWSNGQFRNYTTANGLSTTQVQMVYEDRSGGIWVGTLNGIDHLENDHFVRLSSIPDDFAWPLGESPSGALYVSLNDGGVFRVDNNRLIEVIPQTMAATYLTESKQGDLWLSGSGILRAPRTTFENPRGTDEPPDFEIYGVDDGMATAQCSTGYPSLTFTPDGKLWVATIKGLAMLDLPRLPITDRKPAIYMQEFTVGRNQQLPGQELLLSAGTSHVELRFDAIEITSPEKIRMQYRMDGVDSEWLDVKPPGRAIYSTLPPGTHAFHVRACNRNGIWDRTGMVYLIIQKPFFYQTTWFRLAVIATASLVVAGLYHLRLRQATARLKVRFDERLDERTRIARELHDTLLQTVQGSKFVADHTLEKSDDSVPVHVRQALERLSKWLGQATQEGRAALNSLRTSETNDLAAGLRQATKECAIDSAMAFKFSVTGGPRDTHPIARDEIYRIGYEVIRNACEHSSASELEITLTYAQDLTLRVSDNGRGIEAAVLAEGKQGHFGLQGMRERAERIGSKLTLNSSPDSGTEITLIVPGNVIFRKPNARFKRIKSLLGLDGTANSD